MHVKNSLLPRFLARVAVVEDPIVLFFLCCCKGFNVVRGST